MTLVLPPTHEQVLMLLFIAVSAVASTTSVSWTSVFIPGGTGTGMNGGRPKTADAKKAAGTVPGGPDMIDGLMP
jgi:hypothetical protein